jgi:hypothetical protein
VGNVIVAVDFGDARGDQNGPARPGATSVLR